MIKISVTTNYCKTVCLLNRTMAVPCLIQMTDELYIGRGGDNVGLPCSKWCNPFKMRNEADRAKVLDAFVSYANEKAKFGGA